MWLASGIPEEIGYMCWQITLGRQVAFLTPSVMWGWQVESGMKHVVVKYGIPEVCSYEGVAEN